MGVSQEQESKGVVLALSQAGLRVSSVYELVNAKYNYPEAIPVLLRCLVEVETPAVKEGIVRALTVREARGIAEDALLDEFQRIDPSDQDRQMLKWAIANALSVVATGKSFERLSKFACQREHGKSREMLAVALGNMKDSRAVDVLIQLLKDDLMVGHALIGLRKLKAERARHYIEPFRNHPKAWVRTEATKAIEKLAKQS